MNKIKDFFQSLKAAWRLRKNLFRDPVTNLYNRHYFREIAQKELAIARRYDNKLTFVFIDVDNFKQVNDKFGHRKGDEVLRKVGLILKEESRDSDIVARWGGDEFIMLLTKTNSRKAMILIKRIQEIFSHYVREEELNENLGLSFGVEEGQEETMKEIISKADQQMYLRKKNKKNHNK